MTPILSSRVFVGFPVVTIVSVGSPSTTGMCASKDPVVLVEHRKVGFPGGRPLFLVHAGSGGRDSSRDLGDGSPLTDLSTPIVRDCYDTGKIYI